jgi:putative membrane protein
VKEKELMKNATLTLTLAAAVLATPSILAQQSSTSQGSQQSKPDRKTSKFIEEAVKDNHMEIFMAELGLTKAQNPELKSFCQTLKSDHEHANAQLTQIAQSQGVTLDQEDKHKDKMAKKFEDLSGVEFDKGFAEQALKAHQKDIEKYEKASKDVQNSEVKQYITQTLPKLRQHLQHAARIAQSVGADQSTISSIMKKANESVGGTGDSSSSSSSAGGESRSDDDQQGQGSSSTTR